MSHEHIYPEYSISVAFRMFYAADMCLQADETPCTVLYLIKGRKVDMGKGMITKPLELTFHGQPMPGGHFRVTLSSVKSGHEDLPPPVQHVGADDETPPRIGSCKGYQHADEDVDDLPRQERPSRDCKKSLFMKSSQDTPKDAW